MPLLDGKVAIITGSSRGIGHFIAREFAKEGASIVVAARSEQESDPRLPGTIFSVAEEVERLGGKAMPFKLDATKDEDIQACIQATLERFGRIDVLINNAALLFPGPILDLPVRRFDLTYRINIRAPFVFTQAVLPQMLQQGSGTIITISSGAADSPGGNNAAYSISKIAIEKLMSAVAAEVGGRGIRAFGLKPKRLVLTPGATYTGVAGNVETEPEEAMGRAAVWLVSSEEAAQHNGRSFFSLDLLDEFVNR